jgi:hypothetical protein
MDELLDERLARPGIAPHRTPGASPDLAALEVGSGGAPSRFHAKHEVAHRNSMAIVANVPQEEWAQIDAAQRRLA